MISPTPVPTDVHEFRQSSRLLLVFAFLVIVAAFASANYAVVHRLRAMQQQSRTIVENMLTSVELVSRMGRDIGHVRRSLNRHILENDTVVMSQIEADITAANTDFTQAAAAYEPLVTIPGEEVEWERLKEDVAAMKESISELLAFSRVNQDVQARERFIALEPAFDAVADQVSALIQINREAAQQQVDRVTRIQRSVADLQTVLSVAGIVATLLVGLWAIRLIGQREDELTRKSVLLEIRNEDLDAFAGRVAHDLRNPLNTANLAVSQVLQYVPPHEPAAGILRRSMRRMQELIHDMLMFSRATAEPVDLCDPARAVADVCEDVSPRLTSVGKLRINVAAAQVRGNESLLRQAIWNLLDNAIKYRRRDVELAVEMDGNVQGDFYELRISDNGIGIAPDESARVFDPLYRAPNVREVGGTGLGLSIVKRVIEANGGAVSLQSSVGQGTAFTIKLPVVKESY